MKNLNLDALGVQEMCAGEMKETDGGNPFVWLIVGIIVSEMLDRDAPSNFMDGWKAAQK